GNFQLATITGTKFNDTNGNGTLDSGEPGLANVTIFLDTNGNNTLDTGETSTTTDSSGIYSFPNLGPGTYKVREVVPSGWTQTTSNPSDITLASGTNVNSVNFGNFQLVTISGKKF